MNIQKIRDGGAPHTTDAIRSIPHLVDSCGFGQKHGMRHLHEARAAYERFCGGDSSALASVAWNGEHARRHIEGISDHSKKLTSHIGKHQDMLEKVPAELLSSFATVSNQIYEHAKDAEKGLNTLFRQLGRQGDVKELLGTIHNHIEQIYPLMEHLYQKILTHTDLADEYYQLQGHNPQPPKESAPPYYSEKWLRDTLSLL